MRQSTCSVIFQHLKAIAKVIRNHSCVSVIIVFATGAYEQIEGAAMGSSPLWALASQHIYAVYWREIKLEKLDMRVNCQLIIVDMLTTHSP